MKALFLSLCFIFYSVNVLASSSNKVFEQDSLASITQERQGQPFILLLWSVDCPPCMKELATIQKLEQQFGPLAITYVATDGIDNLSNINKTLKSFQLEQRNHWVFTTHMSDRLRYAIDPNWYGELPRAYFYKDAVNRTAHSGIISENDLIKWIEQ